MLRTFTAAALALTLIGGPVFAQGNAPPNNNAPTTTGQPAKADANKTAIAPTGKGKTAKLHVRYIKHAMHVRHIRHVKHAGHVKHTKQVKGVKQSTEKTRS